MIRKQYDSEINLSQEELINLKEEGNIFDMWGSAFLWLDEDKGVEYNLCVDYTSGEEENCSAIYKMEFNHDTGFMETSYDDYVHYEIDPYDKKWEEKLESEMLKAALNFF